MKTYIRRREHNRTLIMVYGGWGVDERVFEPLCNDEFDFILFYNYSADDPLVLPEMKTYDRIILIGWSLGVWAAEYLHQKTGIKADISIAVNGTPIPADDSYGIPLSVFEGTVNNITEENVDKFYLRMFGDKTTYYLNIDRIPRRTIKSLKDELRWMYNRIMEQKEPGFHWDYAVTSDIDRVFPAANLRCYWMKAEGTTHVLHSSPHYFFHEFGSLTEFVAFVESHSPVKKKKKASAKKSVRDPL